MQKIKFFTFITECKKFFCIHVLCAFWKKNLEKLLLNINPNVLIFVPEYIQAFA
jgi:hypothetical protein